MLARAAVPLLAMCLLCLAGVRAIRMAYADDLFFSNTPEAVRRAIRLAPGNALYRVGLAELLDHAGEGPRAALAAAAALKPQDAAIRIRLGLRAEMENDFEDAEHQLLEAARASAKYAPRWTLANYYFRRGQEEEFWRWAKEAFAISYGDRTALFQLCWRVSTDPDAILRKAIPERRPVLADYARFLISRRQWSAAEPLLVRLAETVEASEVGYFLSAIDDLLHQSRFPAALTVWNNLRQRGVTPYEALEPELGAVLTNGDFAVRTVGHGFDWRIPSVSGVFTAQAPPRTGLRISLSGDQPERCEILSQFLPLEPGRGYSLRYRYRSAVATMPFEDADTGMRWEIYRSGGGTGPIAQSVPLSAGETREDALAFRVPGGELGARLVLVYERASGNMRTESTITLERVTLTFAR